jgi:hypothetical protein
MNEKPTTNPGAAPPRYQWRACCPKGHTHGIQLALPAYFLPGSPILDQRERPTGVEIGRHVDTDEEAEHRLWCEQCQDDSFQRYYVLRPDLEYAEEGEHWYEDQARQWLQDRGTKPEHIETAAVCPDCGAPDAHTSGWVEINTGADTGSEGPSSYHYCLTCCDEFKYTETLSEHEYPEPPAAHFPGAPTAALPFPDQEEPAPTPLPAGTVPPRYEPHAEIPLPAHQEEKHPRPDLPAGLRAIDRARAETARHPEKLQSAAPTWVGSSHFRDYPAAVRYYRDQEGENAAAYVQEAAAEGRVSFTPPFCPPGHSVHLDTAGRWWHRVEEAPPA